jgi:hypothetical protein
VGSILQHEAGLDLLPQNLVFEPVSNTIPDDDVALARLQHDRQTTMMGVSNRDPTRRGSSQAPEYTLPTRPAHVEPSPVRATSSIEQEGSPRLLTQPHVSSQLKEDKAVQEKLNELVSNDHPPLL